MSIATRIESIEEHIEQAYDELQGLGADLTNVNKNIENISMVLDDIYDSMPQVSGEGTSLTLDDTRVGKIKSTLKGNTSQSGTPTPTSPIPINVVSGDNEINVVGKNLFDKDNANILNAYFETSIPNLSSNDNARTLYIECLPNTTYTITKLRSQQFNVGCTNTEPIIGTTIQKIENGPLGVYDGNTEVNYTYTTNSTAKYLLVRYAYATQVDLDLMLSSIQIEYGSSASTYEPYLGNTYNINLPVENLFNKDNANYVNGWVDGTTMRLNTINGNRMFYIPCKPNTTYTISRSVITSSFRTTTYDSTPFPTATGSNVDYTVGSVLKNDNGTTLTITTGANAKYLVVHYGKIEDTNLNETLASIQVEYGSKANKLTPFGTTPIELCKIGNYQDYFYKDSDKWYLHKEIGKVVLNGSENWNVNQRTSGYQFDTQLNEKKAGSNTIIEVYSNYFTGTYFNNRDNILNSIYTGNNDSSIRILTNVESTTTNFKNWLSTHNTNVYYILATPTTTEITDTTLIDQLNELEKAQSKENQTNISQVNNDLPFIISASALKEWQESASLSSTLSMANPLSLGNTLNTQENDIQPIEVDNIEPLEEEENE